MTSKNKDLNRAVSELRKHDSEMRTEATVLGNVTLDMESELKTTKGDNVAQSAIIKEL
jgi:hypothetical protein